MVMTIIIITVTYEIMTLKITLRMGFFSVKKTFSVS